MRISILKAALQKAMTALSLICFFSISPKAQVQLSVATSTNGSEVTADVMVVNFTDIISAQFTLSWAPNEMEFQSVGNLNLPGLAQSNFGPISNATGDLTFSWVDLPLEGITLPPCTPIFSITFQSLNGNVAPVTLNSNPTMIEVIELGNIEVGLVQIPDCADVGTISGNIFNDLNDDCLFDLGEQGLEDWKLHIEGVNADYYASSDNDGNYNIYLLPGTYDVSLVLPGNGLWSACQQSQTVSLGINGNETADFPVQAVYDCPAMTVDLSAPLLRRCFHTNYYVHYCNEGTVTAEGAFVEVEFDPFLEVQGSSVPWSNVDGNTYTFPIGDVEVGSCGTISIEVEVSCDAVLGQTHCSVASIFPNDSCIPSNALWDGSDLEVNGTCDGDSVRFEIINLGDDMAEPLEFIVIEDDMILLTSDPILLSSQETAQIAVAANGSTWRVEIPETPNNPFSTFAAEAIEGCGTNSSGSFSLGFVTQFPQPSQGTTEDEDCQENVGSFDPNDKTGYPKGFCAAHYIRADQDIEYHIRFQNTGTDTAFNIVVIDTLSAFLDPATVRTGSSSHPYDFELLGNGVVKFSFPNAMLPDSNTNEPASHGFVNFIVSQRQANPNGTVISNQAAIFFDFNEPVYTNTYSHTIGSDFVEMAGQSGDLNVSGYVTTWWDNEPLENVELNMTNLCPRFTDSYGYFNFETIGEGQYNLSAKKENERPKDGVTVLDILKIRDHITFTTPFENIYQIIAADINGSSNVTTFDLVFISKLILGVETNPEFTKWKFVTGDSNPNLPFSNVFSVYEYPFLEISLDNQDFIAIQPGNVISEDMVETIPLETEFVFEEETTQGNTVRINVKSNNFENLRGFQYGIKWNKDVLELAEIEDGQLINMNGRISNGEGVLDLVWIIGNNIGVSYNPNETLFTLVFNALGQEGASTTLELNEEGTPMQVVVEGCKLASGKVQSTEVTISDPNSTIDLGNAGIKVSIAPNPLPQNQPLQVAIETKKAETLQLQFYDLNGSLLKTQRRHFAAGKNNLQLPLGFSKGLYFVKIKNGEGVEGTVKLVVY